MPSYTLELPDDEPDSPGESGFYSDESPVEGVGEVKPIKGDSVTHADLTKIMRDELGMSESESRRKGSETINERLKRISDYVKTQGEEIAIQYRKDHPSKKKTVPPKTKKPERVSSSVPSPKKQKTLLGTLFEGSNAPTKISDKGYPDTWDLPAKKRTKLTPIEGDALEIDSPPSQPSLPLEPEAPGRDKGPFTYDKGHWVKGEDPRGLPKGHIAYDPPISWVQEHDSLLKDAVNSWKGSPTDMGLHLQEMVRGVNSNSSGSGKIMRSQSEALYKEVLENDKPAPTLYRGDIKDPKDNTSVLLGWTSDRKTADKWAKKYGGKVYTLEGARGLEAETVPGITRTFAEKEWIIPHANADGVKLPVADPSVPKKTTRPRRERYDEREHKRAMRAEEKMKVSKDDLEFFDPRVFAKDEVPESMGRGFVITDNMGGALGPPKKPPAPPSGSSSPGDEDDEFLPGPGEEPTVTAADLDKDREKRIRAEQDAAIADAKRAQDRAAKRKRAEQARAFQQERKRIYAETQRTAREITAQDSVSTTDRIVRRLTSFGIGRTLGSSGQLFAAAMEFGVFRPDEEGAKDALQSDRDALEKKKLDRLNALEDDIFKARQDAEEMKNFVEDVINTSKRQLKGASSIEERDEIIGKMEDDLNRGYRSPAGRGSGRSGGGTPPPGSPPSSLPSGGGNNRGLTGPINPNLPPTGNRGGGPPGPTGPTGNQGGGPNRRGFPIPLTPALLGTYAITQAIEAVEQIDKALIASVRSIGTVDVERQSGAGPTINAARTPARISGATTGAVAGGLAGLVATGGNPIGAVLGGIIGGKAGDSGADVIVTAIEAGNAILENFVTSSYDANTITEQANQEIATLLAKMEANEEVSEQTVAYVQGVGELNRAIIGFQKVFVSQFGDAISNILKALTGLVQIGTGLLNFSGEFLEAFSTTNPMLGLLYKAAKQILATLGIVSDSLIDAVNGDVGAFAEIEKFFSTQSQFQNKQGRTRFGTNIGNFVGP